MKKRKLARYIGACAEAKSGKKIRKVVEIEEKGTTIEHRAKEQDQPWQWNIPLDKASVDLVRWLRFTFRYM